MAGAVRAAFRIAAPSAVFLAAAVACYSPTEIQLVLTTQVPCGPGAELDTEIYIALAAELDGGTLAPTAAVRGCKPDEPRVGTLTIVPSGSRDGRFEVEIFAGVGVAASTCRGAGRASCIVARRRVGFREHQSLKVPILLSERCIGVPCGFEQTCDLGICTSTLDCNEESGCPRERGELPVVDAGPAGPDAPAIVIDAAVDASTDAGLLEEVCGPTAETVIDAQAIVGQLSLDKEDFVYANVPSAATGQIRRVSRRGGAATVVRNVPGLMAVAARADGFGWAASTAAAPGGELVQSISGMEKSAVLATFQTSAIAFSGKFLVGLMAQSPEAGDRAFSFGVAMNGNSTFDSNIAILPGPSPEILVDDEGHFLGVAGSATLGHWRSTPALALVDFISMQSPSADIALVGHTV